ASADVRTTADALPRRWMDAGAGRPPPARQPHERVRALPPGPDRGRAHHQGLRRSPVGRTARRLVVGHRVVDGVARRPARSMGEPAAPAVAGAVDTHVPAPGAWSRRARPRSGALRVARSPPRSAHHVAAEAAGLVARPDAVRLSRDA